MDRVAIETRVRALVADSLAVPLSDVSLESRLTDDLGAGSLDFVDLVFGVEKAFDVKLRDSELDFLLRLDFGSPEVMREGFLTPQTVARVAEWLPALGVVPDPARVSPRELFSMVTVEALAGVVERRLRAAGR